MKSPVQRYLASLVEGESLAREDAAHLAQIILNDGATPAQIGGALVALRMKGETPQELAGFSDVMSAKALPFTAPENAVDNCGTGGDGMELLNVSTLAAFIVAACGVPVAKHGNRASSSRCGSADVLEALGINIDAPRALQEKSLCEVGLCFLMAPLYHKTMYRVGPTRKDIAIRTIFNLVGPTANPAKPARQLVGVFSREWLRPMAETLKALGKKRALVVHSADGSDEISIFADTFAVELQENGEIEEYVISPERFGLPGDFAPEELKGGDPKFNAQAMHRALIGKERTAFAAAGALNAAATLYVAGACESLEEGFALSVDALTEGKCVDILRNFMEISREEI